MIHSPLLDSICEVISPELNQLYKIGEKETKATRLIHLPAGKDIFTK
jgi:hypothetical protein